MSISPLRFVFGATVLAAAAMISSPATAEAGDGGQLSERVSMAGLDMARERDRRMAEEQLRAAARRVCSVGLAPSPSHLETVACTRRVAADARLELRNAIRMQASSHGPLAASIQVIFRR